MKRNRPKTKRLLEAERQHEKFLKKIGIRSRSSVGLEHQISNLNVIRSNRIGITKNMSIGGAQMGTGGAQTSVGDDQMGVGVGTQGGLINLSAADNRSRKGSNPLAPTKYLGLAQSGRASAPEAGCRKFESSIPDRSLIANSYNSSMSKKEPMIYTGTEIIGIAQMHKSNAVPIRSKKDAIDISRMRRNNV